MNHPGQSLWEKYVEGSLEESVREQCEEHLAACEQCLGLYMNVLEQQQELPQLTDETVFLEAVMERYDAARWDQEDGRLVMPDEPEHKLKGSGAERGIERPPRRKGLHPIVHYAVAAIITAVLMSAGVFDSLTERMGQLEMQHSEGAEARPVSERLLDKTSEMIDSLHAKPDRGGK